MVTFKQLTNFPLPLHNDPAATNKKKIENIIFKKSKTDINRDSFRNMINTFMNNLGYGCNIFFIQDKKFRM